jgi:DNA-binding CsgD family transcriptional regulator/tetratricopeptide (TPR) repeat protein
VQLFAQNARRVQPGFSLGKEQAAVIRICSLVQGMPLALELASAWTRVLSCDEIAVEIEHGLDILETSARNVPERHRSMRAVLNQSWARLTDGEREVFRKLSPFRGGFTREAAAVVSGASIHNLSALVDKSWLYRSTIPGRYDIHELVRQFGEERLAESGESAALNHAHAAFYADLVRRCEAGIKDRRQSEALAEMERDFENIRSAWKWAADQRAAALSNRMMEGLNFFCDMRARFHEGEELFRYAAERYAAQDRATFYRARARHTRMIMLGMLEDNHPGDESARELEAAARFAHEHSDPVELVFALYMLGMTQSENCCPDDALRSFRSALEIATELNDRFYKAELLAWIGVMMENLREALPLHQQAIAIQREIGDMNGLAWNLLHLSRIAFWDNRQNEAETFAAEAETIQRERGDLKGLSWTMLMGSERALQLGKFEEAQHRAEEAERIADRLRLPSVTQATLAWEGLLKIITETDYVEGERLCRQSLTMRAPVHWGIGDARLYATIGLLIAAYHAGDSAGVRDSYEVLARLVESLGLDDLTCLAELAPMGIILLVDSGEDERAAELFGWTQNFRLTLDDSMLFWSGDLPLMQRIADELEARLGKECFEEAWERGKLYAIETLLAELRCLPQTINVDTPDNGAAAASSASDPDALTDREREVLALLAVGLSNRQIAAQLVLALGTVKWYISVIYSKLGVTSRTQAVARARELKLVA